MHDIKNMKVRTRKIYIKNYTHPPIFEQSTFQIKIFNTNNNIIIIKKNNFFIRAAANKGWG